MRDLDQCVDYNILKSASETTPKKSKVPLKLGEKKSNMLLKLKGKKKKMRSKKIGKF